MTVTKRDGRQVEFDKDKIVKAISKAFVEVYSTITDEMSGFANKIATEISSKEADMSVEEIQDVVTKKLMLSRYKDVARRYIEYRYLHHLVRESNTTDKSIKELIDGENDYWNTENSNKNPRVVTTQRDYIAGITSTDIARRFLLPPEVVKAHDEGILHFHDMDYFAQKSLHNCELVNLEDMLQNGTVINGVKIDKPHRLLTAATIATQIITAVTSSSYGGCSINLSHLAPFVRDSYKYHKNKYLRRGMNELDAEGFAGQDTDKEVSDAVQTFNYQVNSMTNTNGQAPFLSVFMYINDNIEYRAETVTLIAEFLRQRMIGFKNEVGHYVTPAFPKLLYVLDENNCEPNTEYWWLTKLAAECTAKRMVPDYISAKIMKRDKIDANGNGNVFACMGCRSFLTPYLDSNNKPKYWGRFNQGVVTINLPDVALSSKGDKEKFWQLFDERLELCHKAMQCRHERLAIATSDVAPILWQHGALARLPKGASIHPLLHGGYSTLSLGYAGLYECVKYMTGESHSHGNGKEFGLAVMRHLNDKCNEWKEAEDIAYSPYGSPIESTTYKFAKCLKKRFGVIEGITDKDYITNSYHINVREEIDPFSKLAIEAEYQKLSQGGAISYIECADLTNNIPAVLEVIKFIYNNIMYAELNTKSDYCQVCGYDGEIEIVDNDGTLSWRCPNCGNTDQTKMNVARRTCGYIGSQFWNQGRTQEIKERYVHLDNHEMK
nr:MAG TPA: anaerobic ribonucleoside triphosphate reductase [Caudoviricetes sp.]